MDKFIVIDEDMDFVCASDSEKVAIRTAEDVLNEEGNDHYPFPLFLYELKSEFEAQIGSVKLIPNKAKK